MIEQYKDKKYLLILLPIIFLLTILGLKKKKSANLKTVNYVDLNKYEGKWHEIASIPHPFQKGCECTTAEYNLSDKGYVNVLNKCQKEGRTSEVPGKAFIVPNSNNSKLKVQFFWPFKGDYWVLELGDNYEYSVVGHPNRKYLWILARENKMNSNLYNDILSRLKEKGFKTENISLTGELND